MISMDVRGEIANLRCDKCGGLEIMGRDTLGEQLGEIQPFEVLAVAVRCAETDVG